jgi:hypothetical protein
MKRVLLKTIAWWLVVSGQWSVASGQLLEGTRQLPVASGRQNEMWTTAGIRCTNPDDQIEVGGPIAGVEFHGSRPVPSRISFYSPVANSVDLSTDYWKRGDSRPLLLGIKFDSQPRRWLGKEPWEHVVAPQSARFERQDGDLFESISYEFGVSDLATAMTLRFENKGTVPHTLELYAHLALTLRSCQSYARINAARTQFDKLHKGVVAEFDDARVARASLFVLNAGEAPSSWTTSLATRDSGWSDWIDGAGDLAGSTARVDSPVAAFTYKFVLPPGGARRVILLIGSTPRSDTKRAVAGASLGWGKEIRQYNEHILTAHSPSFMSGDAWTDSAVSYSRNILTANEHFLNGNVVPMPCPAEYNFFFTHDVLLTDLSAIMFDADRVKRDLLYIAKLAKNGDLPHAYYWKDDGFKTEFCPPGNWNNLWAVLATAAYYRHTFETKTAARLHPLLTRALEKTLTMRKGNLLHGVEPDWWDFGKAPGARAYLTTLTIRALEEYVYLSSQLRLDLSRLPALEQEASELKAGLNAELWDGSYLYNTTPAGRDEHVYMGPLLSAVYGLLPPDRAKKLVATAGSQLLDPGVGIRTVWPADFHTDSVKKFYGVKENEAGNQFLYANGGIWYLGNAWYAWALRATGEVQQAFDFFRHTMTPDGIARSPYGQPALYEYRYADSSAPDHGRVDKPTMMWSAGFCIGTAYRMAGFADNTWNVTVGDITPSALENVSAKMVFGKLKSVSRRGKGPMVTRLLVDGREIPSRILPVDARTGSSITVEMGPILYPFVDSVNAVLHTARIDPKARTMQLSLSSFERHQTTIRLLTPWMARAVTINGKVWSGWGVSSTPVGTLVITIRYEATSGSDAVQINF